MHLILAFIGILFLVTVGNCSDCDIIPEDIAKPKNRNEIDRYIIYIQGNPKTYTPNQKYNVSLKVNPNKRPQKAFRQFFLTLESVDGETEASAFRPTGQFEFEVHSQIISRFSDTCRNTVIENTKIPKWEVQVYWVAPPSGSGCVAIKATVVETKENWFSEDGQLTKILCEDMETDENAKPPPVEKCCACSEAKYEMAFEGRWTRNTHPRNYPSDIWSTKFSDIIGSSHRKYHTFWNEQDYASEGIKDLAESGRTQHVESEIKVMGNNIRTIIKARGLQHPNITDTSYAVFRVDSNNHLVSLVSKITPSPDWFVGVSNFELCQSDCTWIESYTYNLYPFDAGTDDGIGYLSSEPLRFSRKPILPITPNNPNDPKSPFYDEDGNPMNPIAKLHFTRQRLYEKVCDSTEDSNSKEEDACATTKWGDWTPCSVPCGLGRKTRMRQYVEPKNAQDCYVRLVQHQSCLGTAKYCKKSRYKAPKNSDEEKEEDSDEKKKSVEKSDEKESDEERISKHKGSRAKKKKASEEKGSDDKESGEGESEESKSDGKGSKEKDSDEKGSEENASEKKGTEKKGSEEKGSEEKGSEEKGPEEKGSKKKDSEEKNSEKKDSEEKGSEEKGSEEKGSEKKGSEEKDSEEKGSDEKDSEEKGSDEKDSEEKGSEEKGSEEKGSEKKDSEEKDSEDKSSEKGGSEEKESKEKKSVEKGSNQKASHQKGSDEKRSDEKGSDQKGSESGKSEENGQEEKGSEEKTAKKKSNKKGHKKKWSNRKKPKGSEEKNTEENEKSGEKNSKEEEEEEEEKRSTETDCTVGVWSEWSSCSVTCGKGTRTRDRKLINPENEDNCQDVELQENSICRGVKKKCDDESESKCSNTNWGSWSACSVSCGTGIKKRLRLPPEPKKKSRKNTSNDDRGDEDEENCSTSETVKCHIDCSANRIGESLIIEQAPDGRVVNCKVSEWSIWSKCQVQSRGNTCGRGSKKRSRQILRHPENGGRACPRKLFQTRTCTVTCPSNEDNSAREKINAEATSSPKCIMSDWTDFTPCSSICGSSAMQLKTRKILYKPPGVVCPSRVLYKPCNLPLACTSDGRPIFL